MNRRGFISLLTGSAGAAFVPWRGLIVPLISLPPRPHVCDSPWCNHPSHFKPLTAEEIVADIERTMRQILTVGSVTSGTIEPGMWIYDGHRFLGTVVGVAHGRLELAY